MGYFAKSGTLRSLQYSLNMAIKNTLSKPPALPKVRSSLIIIVACLVVRLLLHCLYFPKYEGPDEPFHLARSVSMANSSLAQGWKGEEFSAELAADVSREPCGPDLQRVFGCSSFGEGGISPQRTQSLKMGAITNYEAHQPPLWYAALAVPLKVLQAVLGSHHERSSFTAELLVARLFSVVLVCVGLWCLRRFVASLGLAGGGLFLSLPISSGILGIRRARCQ